MLLNAVNDLDALDVRLISVAHGESKGRFIEQLKIRKMGRGNHEHWPDSSYQLRSCSPGLDKFDLHSHFTST